MRLALLGCAAALTLVGAAAAQAETIYVTEPGYAATAPGYVYTAPAPMGAPQYSPRYVITAEDPPMMADPRSSYVVVAPPVVVNPPVMVERRDTFANEPIDSYAVPRGSGIVTTGFSNRSCYLDRNGFERCY